VGIQFNHERTPINANEIRLSMRFSTRCRQLTNRDATGAVPNCNTSEATFSRRFLTADFADVLLRLRSLVAAAAALGPFVVICLNDFACGLTGSLRVQVPLCLLRYLLFETTAGRLTTLNWRLVAQALLRFGAQVFRFAMHSI